jgi:hypothetical protein
VVATITEYDGITLVDPDSGTNDPIFYDPTGTSQGTGTVIKSSLGVYYCDYILASTATPGDWRCDWYCEVGGEPATGRIRFTVIS